MRLTCTRGEERSSFPLPEGEAILGRDGTAEEFAQAAERAQLVIECVQALPPRYRQGLDLLFRQGCTYREVADEMGIKVEGVGPLRQRALDRLLSLLRLRGLLDDAAQRPGDRPQARKRGTKSAEQEPSDGPVEPVEPGAGERADPPRRTERSAGSDESGSR